eukprot:GHVU01060152.1.p1 GENE.GHVU01060152.1~~GHVU01060152.1.p1  ORF type:complete len:132 (+),score=7.56 GHVU01060152.1:111-506(+)
MTLLVQRRNEETPPAEQLQQEERTSKVFEIGSVFLWLPLHLTLSEPLAVQYQFPDRRSQSVSPGRRCLRALQRKLPSLVLPMRESGTGKGREGGHNRPVNIGSPLRHDRHPHAYVRTRAQSHTHTHNRAPA